MRIPIILLYYNAELHIPNCSYNSLIRLITDFILPVRQEERLWKIHTDENMRKENECQIK